MRSTTPYTKKDVLRVLSRVSLPNIKKGSRNWPMKKVFSYKRESEVRLLIKRLMLSTMHFLKRHQKKRPRNRGKSNRSEKGMRLLNYNRRGLTRI